MEIDFVQPIMINVSFPNEMALNVDNEWLHTQFAICPFCPSVVNSNSPVPTNCNLLIKWPVPNQYDYPFWQLNGGGIETNMASFLLF